MSNRKDFKKRIMKEHYDNLPPQVKEEGPSFIQKQKDRHGKDKHDLKVKSGRVKAAIGTPQKGTSVIVKGKKRKKPIPKRIRRKSKKK